MKPATPATTNTAPKSSARFCASVLSRESTARKGPGRALGKPACSAGELPDEAETFEREGGIDAADRDGVRGAQVGEPTRRYRLRVDAERRPGPPHDPVDLACEAVDEPGLERGDRRVPDHGRRRREVDFHEPR